MFKMGCSMARRILAIDGKGNNSSGQDQLGAGCSSSSSPASSKNQGRKDKQHLAGGAGAGGDSTAAAATSATSPKTKTTEELNDFSKLEDDPRIPLNVRQIFKITKSWKAIARTMSKTGTAMFLNLFEQNEDLFYLFDRFQHLKGKDLHDSMELREHAATVMSTLDQSINSLSDYDNFVNYLHSIGKLHRKVPGFKRAYFWKIEQPFLKAVKQTLDERCNETIEEIYKIAIKLILETIADGYGEDQLESGDKLGADRDKPASADGGDSANGGGNGGARKQPRPTNGGDTANEHNARGGQDKSQFVVGTTAAAATKGALASIDPRPKVNIRGNNNIALARDDVRLEHDTAAEQLNAPPEQSSAPSRRSARPLLASTSPIDEEASQQLDNGRQNVGVRVKEALPNGADNPFGGSPLSSGKHRTSRTLMSHEGGEDEPAVEAEASLALTARATSTDSSSDSLKSTLFVLRELLFLSLKTEMKRQLEEKLEPKEKKTKRRQAKEATTKTKKNKLQKEGTAKSLDGRMRNYRRNDDYDDNGAAFIGHEKEQEKARGGERGNQTCSRLAGNSISLSGCPKLLGQLSKGTTKTPTTSLSSMTAMATATTATKDCTEEDWLAATATRAKTRPAAASTKAEQDSKKGDICNCENKGDKEVCDDNQEADWRSRELNTSCRHQQRPELFRVSSSFTAETSKRATVTGDSSTRHSPRENAETQVCEQPEPGNNKALASSIYLASVAGVEFASAEGEQERRADTTIVGLQQAEAPTDAEPNASACATGRYSAGVDVPMLETTSSRTTAKRQARMGERGGEESQLAGGRDNTEQQQQQQRQAENSRQGRPDGQLDACWRQMATSHHASLAGSSQTGTSCCQCNNASEFGGHQKANDEPATWTSLVAMTPMGEPSKVCAQSKNESSNIDRQNQHRPRCCQSPPFSLAPPLSDSRAGPRSPMGAASGDGHHATDDRGRGGARSAGQLTSSSLLAKSQEALESLRPAQSFKCCCQRLACETSDCSCNGNESSSSESRSSNGRSSRGKAKRNNGECQSKSLRELQAHTWGQLDCSLAKPIVFAKAEAETADEMGEQVCPASAITARAAVACCPSSRQSAAANQASCRSATPVVEIESVPPKVEGALTMPPPIPGTQNSLNSAANVRLPAQKSPSVWRQIKHSSSSLVLSASRRMKRRKGGDVANRHTTKAAAASSGSHDDRFNYHKSCQRSIDDSSAISDESYVGSTQPELQQPIPKQLHNFLLTSDPSELGKLIKMLMLALANRNSSKGPGCANGNGVEVSPPPLRRHYNENIGTITTDTSINLRLLSTNC